MTIAHVAGKAITYNTYMTSLHLSNHPSPATRLKLHYTKTPNPKSKTAIGNTAIPRNYGTRPQNTQSPKTTRCSCFLRNTPVSFPFAFIVDLVVLLQRCRTSYSTDSQRTRFILHL